MKLLRLATELKSWKENRKCKSFCVFQGATHLFRCLVTLDRESWYYTQQPRALSGQEMKGEEGVGYNDLIRLHDSWQKPVKAGSLKPDPITACGWVNCALWSRYHWHTRVCGEPFFPSPGHHQARPWWEMSKMTHQWVDQPSERMPQKWQAPSNLLLLMGIKWLFHPLGLCWRQWPQKWYWPEFHFVAVSSSQSNELVFLSRSSTELK